MARQYFEVDDNPNDIPLSTEELIQRLQDKEGAIILLADRIDEAVLSRCPKLKIVCNVTVGFDNIDVEALYPP